MPANRKIVIFGSVVQDLVSYTDHFPRPGESVRGNAFLTGGGGKGANQAVAAARLGVDVHFIGKVGDDLFGDANITGLEKAGVNVDHLEKSSTSPTATATITVNKEGENTIVVTLGANLELTAEVADRLESVIASAGLVVCQAEIPQSANRRVFEIARKYNGKIIKGKISYISVKTFFNPAPGDRNLDTSVLSLVDIICTNENEAEFITGIPAPTVEEAEKAAKKMLEMGVESAIVTLGGKGAIVATKTKVIHIPATPTTVVDTTGAGDCFCGTFAALFMAGADVFDAARSATAVSSLSVQRKGTQNSYWKKEEILEKHPEIKI